MPFIAASYTLNSQSPNFTRDQVQNLTELEQFGNVAGKTPIDIGHITFVVSENKHYTYIELADDQGHPSGNYAWVPFTGASSGGNGGGDEGGGDEPATGLYAYFKSMVFKRGGLSAPATPGNSFDPSSSSFGGTYAEPWPLGWSDGIPAVTNQQEQVIWMSTRIFSSGGSADPLQATYNWTTPQIIADTESKDFEFSSSTETPQPPQKTWAGDDTDYNDGWSNTATEDTVWMAMRDVESQLYPVGSSWEIVKIKGEDGQQATMIKILGTVNAVTALSGLTGQYMEAYIVLTDQGNYVYTWDGDSWSNCGKFKGTYDNSKDWAYLHIKYSDNGQTFTAAFGEVPGSWVGTYCDYDINDSSVFNDYYWKEITKEDAFGKEEIFYLTSTDEAPLVPTSHVNDLGQNWNDFDFVPNNWYDDYPGVSSQARYCWYCSRRKVNGVWDEFRGVDGLSGAEGGVAKLYIYLPADAVASAASRTFMAYTWTTKTPDSPASAPVAIVPEALAADVATWDVQNNTLVLATGKTWQTDTDTTVNGSVVKATWSTNPGNNPGKYLWMSTATFSEANNGAIVGTWSTPVCLSGEDGRNGTDGEWKAFAYHLCTSRSQFEGLSAPTLSDPEEEDSLDSGSQDPNTGLWSGWTDHPQGISEDFPIEAASIGVRDRNTETWSYDTPFIWSRWGEDGIDGDGVEYLYIIATQSEVQDVLDSVTNEPTGKKELIPALYLPQNLAEFNQYLESIDITESSDKAEALNTYYTDRQNEWMPAGTLGTRWTDDPSDVSQFEPYEFVSVRKYGYDSVSGEFRWGFWSKPALWAKFGKDGTAGRSVFTSMVFCRTSRYDLGAAVLTGGTMDNPKPTSTVIEVLDSVTNEPTPVDLQAENPPLVWSDSVPSTPASAPVWMASRVFNTDETTQWSYPVELHDAPGFQVEYTAEEVWNTAALPSLNNPRYQDDSLHEGINETLWRQDALTATGAVWGDIGVGQNDIVDPWWMITSRKTTGGQWTSWAIFKVKGEKGETGTSISVKGSLSSYIDLGDPTGSPAGLVNHSSLSNGDCYTINGLLWIYDDNATKSSPYDNSNVHDQSGNNQEQGDQYAGFTCQGQFKGDPGEPGTSSWLFIRFANKSDDTTSPASNSRMRLSLNGESFWIEFTDNNGIVPGKYSGTYIARTNSASLNISDYTWSEWRGDDLYGTEQIFKLSDINPCQDPEHLDQQPGHPMPPAEENANHDLADWYVFDHVPTGWSDTPLSPEPNAHCWVSTRRLSDPEGYIDWSTPVIYSRYAKDGDRGEDGTVNEFIYHLGEESTVYQKVLTTAKTGDSAAITIQAADVAEWWASDESRDYRPGDGLGGFWTDNPSGVEDISGKHVEYYCSRSRDYDAANNVYVWTEWSPIKVWSTWGKKGNDGDGVEYIFALTADTDHNPPSVAVADKVNTVIEGKHWDDYDFVPTGWTDDPTGTDPSHRCEWVSIRRSHSENGVTTWDDFSTPAIWSMYVEDGKDGDSQEFVFCRCASRDSQNAPGLDDSRAYGLVNNVPTIYDTANQNPPDWQNLRDFVPGVTGQPNQWWMDSPLGVTEEIPLEYYSIRFRKNEVWTEWSDVMVWSEWGKTGRDGDGVEYIFKATQSSTLSQNDYPNGTTYNNKTWANDDFVPEGWVDDPPTPDRTNNRYIWVSIRKTIGGSWGDYGTGTGQNSWSQPIIWTSYLDAVLEQKVYHYGTKTTAPSLVQWVQQGGESVRPEGYQNDNYLPKDSSNVSWTAEPQGITTSNRYEWEAVRRKDPETGLWGDYSANPHLYAAWGDDGNGIEFVFWLVTAEEKAYIDSQESVMPYSLPGDNTAVDDYFPYVSFGQGNRTDVQADDIPGNMSAAYPYLYASKRDKKNGTWQPFCGIFIFNQLNLAPDYACTLNLSEDFQGVAVVESGNIYNSIASSVSAGRNTISLNYGPDELNISKVSIQPIMTDASTGISSVGEEFEIWRASANGAENSRSVNVDGNTITFTITKSSGVVLLRWSAATSLTFKKKNSAPLDLSFIVSAKETEANDARGGYATYNIHPVLGDVVYELAPKVDVFKKLATSPFNAPQALTFEIEKNIYSDGKPASLLATPDDWNAGLQVKYRQDEGSWITISGNLSAVSGQQWSSALSGSGNGYSWTVRGYTENVQSPYVQVNIYLYSGGTDLAENVVSGYSVQLYKSSDLHDEEFIPALYDGKKGTKGDYYKYEYAYYLTDTDNWNTSNNPVNGTDYPATDTANHKAWRSTIISPDNTYRFLFATKRLCKYYGDDVDDNGQSVTPGSRIGTPGDWELPVFLYASKSLPDDQIRSIDTITEYYQWTVDDVAPNKTPISNWTANQIPTATGNQKYLWNFEVITYTYGSPPSTETNPGKVGNLSEDGRSVVSFTEYYFWSALDTGNAGTYGSSGVAYPTIQASNLNSTSTPLKSWWTGDNRTRLNNQRNESGANRKYLWNFERITYDKGTNLTEDSDPVMISQLGDPGRSVESFIEYYKWVSTSGTPSTPTIETIISNINNASIDGWYKDTMPPAGTNDKYLWNFEVIQYSYDNPTKTPPACIGTIGDDGKGITSVTDYYFWSHKGTGSGGAYDATGTTYAYPLVSTINNTSSPLASWWSADNQSQLNAQVTDTTADRRYLWNFEATVYEGSSTPVNSTPVLIAINGANGDVGKGIQSVQEYYLWTETDTLTSDQLASAAASDPTASTISAENRWSTSPEKTYYLWNSEHITSETPSVDAYATPRSLGSFGSSRIISTISNQYARSSNASTAPSSGWKTTASEVTLTSTYKNLWVKETVNFTSGDPINSTAARIYQSSSSTSFSPSIEERYLITDDADLTPTASSIGWDTLANTVDAKQNSLRYLWNFEVTTYTTGQKYSTSPALIGSIGTNGTDGRGLVSIQEFYYWGTDNDEDLPAQSIRNDLSEIAEGEDNKTWWDNDHQVYLEAQSEISEDRRFLWNFEVITYTSGEPEVTDPIIISTRGIKGKDGTQTQFVYFRTKTKDISTGMIQYNSVSHVYIDDGEAMPVFRYIDNSQLNPGGGTVYIYITPEAHSAQHSDSNEYSYVTDDPQGVNSTWKYEYESIGQCDDSTGGNWVFSKPVLHWNYSPGATYTKYLYKATNTTSYPAPFVANDTYPKRANITALTGNTYQWKESIAETTFGSTDQYLWYTTTTATAGVDVGMADWTEPEVMMVYGGPGPAGKDAVPIRIRNLSDVWDETLSGDNRIFSGFEDNAPFRDIIVLDRSSWIAAGKNIDNYPYHETVNSTTVNHPVLFVVNYGDGTANTGKVGLQTPLTTLDDSNFQVPTRVGSVFPANKAISFSQNKDGYWWGEFQNLGGIAVDLLVAAQAYISSLQFDQATTLSSTGNGGSHLEIHDGFIEFYDGNTSEAHPKGIIRIRIGQPSGQGKVPVLEFFDANGRLLYDLGPNGIQWASDGAIYDGCSFSDGISVAYLCGIGDNVSATQFLGSALISRGPYYAFTPAKKSGNGFSTQYYIYNQKKGDGVSGHGWQSADRAFPYDGLLVPTRSTYSLIPNGASSEIDVWPQIPEDLIPNTTSKLPDGWYIETTGGLESNCSTDFDDSLISTFTTYPANSLVAAGEVSNYPDRFANQTRYQVYGIVDAYQSGDNFSQGKCYLLDPDDPFLGVYIQDGITQSERNYGSSGNGNVTVQAGQTITVSGFLVEQSGGAKNLRYASIVTDGVEVGEEEG